MQLFDQVQHALTLPRLCPAYKSNFGTLKIFERQPMGEIMNAPTESQMQRLRNLLAGMQDLLARETAVVESWRAQQAKSGIEKVWGKLD